MRKRKLEELNRPDLETYRSQPKKPVVLILDNVRSLHNVGSAFRTADAFSIEKIYLCGITGTPPNREINKSALGATESVHWEYAKDSLDIVSKLKESGYKIIAVEQTDSSKLLSEVKLSGQSHYALIFGNEVFGVDENLLEQCDESWEIPQFGTKHSLNVSVSIGIVLWHFFLGTSGNQ